MVYSENGVDDEDEEEIREDLIPLVETVNQTQCCGGLKRSAVCTIA
jgi:hypothetical protein